MNVYTCTSHATHYPVGGASIVVAPDEETARSLLAAALAEQGLSDPGELKFQRLDLENPHAIVLCNGDY